MLKNVSIKVLYRCYKFSLKKYQPKSIVNQKATPTKVNNNQEFLSLNSYFFRQLCHLLYQQRQQSEKIIYNPAYCNGIQYQQFTLDKLVQIGIKKLQQYQQTPDENTQQFWRIFQQSATFHMKYCPPDELTRIFYLCNHHNQKYNFKKSFKNKLFEAITDQLPVMTLNQLKNLYLLGQQSQYIFVANTKYSNNVKFIEKIQNKVLDTIDERVSKIPTQTAAQWIKLLFWNSINSIIFTHHEQKKKQRTSAIINKLFQHIIKQSSKLELVNILELMRITTFQQYQNSTEKMINSDRLSKLKQILIKLLSQTHFFEYFQKTQFISYKLLLQFFSQSQFKNLEISAIKSLYVRYVYLQELFRHWSYQTLTSSQIISRYQQLDFTPEDMHQLINIPKLCMMIELGYKNLHAQDFQDKRQIIEKFIDDLQYIPFGLQANIRHYCLLSNQTSIQNIMSKITSSLTRNPQKLSELVQMNHQHLLQNKDVKDLKKFFINLKNLDLKVGQYVLKANNFAHFIDLKQKLVIHCLENNEDFIETNAQENDNVTTQSIIHQQSRPKTILKATQWFKIKKLMWEKDGFYFIGIHVPSYLQKNWTERINLFEKSLLQSQESHKQLQSRSLNYHRND